MILTEAQRQALQDLVLIDHAGKLLDEVQERYIRTNGQIVESIAQLQHELAVRIGEATKKVLDEFDI